MGDSNTAQMGQHDTGHSPDEVEPEATFAEEIHQPPSEDALAEVYQEWNPMAEESSSFLNKPGLNDPDPSSLITGDGAGASLNTADIQCPFYNGKTDKCFKQKCYYKHDKLLAHALTTKNPQIIDALRIQPIPTLIASLLKPRQTATEGSMIVAHITCIVSPSEFYVVPVSDWSCTCEKSSIHDCDYDRKNEGIENLARMWVNMDYSLTHHSHHSNFYTENELVAVKLTTSDKTKQWFRAMVLEDSGIGETNEMPTVQLKLIDIGTVVSTSARNIFPLTEDFLEWPPLAHKCGLFGISPITHKWSRRAVEYFRTLAQEQTCLLEIKRSLRQAAPDEDGAYLVSVRLKLNGEYINVAHKLGDEGLGLEWHPFPARPKVLDALPADEARAFAELTKPFGQQSMPAHPKVPETVTKREVDRMHSYFNKNSA